MATLADIKKQIASLEKQAAALLKEAASEAAKKAAALIEQHGLTAADVGLAPKSGRTAALKKAVAKAKTKPATAKPAGVPKYRDPKSGKTWTGNGQAPGWIAGAKNRDKFLIRAPESAARLEPAPLQRPSRCVRRQKRSARKRWSLPSQPRPRWWRRRPPSLSPCRWRRQRQKMQPPRGLRSRLYSSPRLPTASAPQRRWPLARADSLHWTPGCQARHRHRTQQLPDTRIDRVIRSVQNNKGKLSGALRKELSILDERGFLDAGQRQPARRTR